MTIRHTSAAAALHNQFRNFARCTEEAPAGAYEAQKALREKIGEAADNLMAAVRAEGLLADNCDAIFHVEATIYAYIKESNPTSSMFLVAEGFGAHMDGPARERVMENCARYLAALRQRGMTEG